MSNQRPTCPFGAPRWEPNDRKRVRSRRVGHSIARTAGVTNGRLHAARRIFYFVAMRGHRNLLQEFETSYGSSERVAFDSSHSLVAQFENFNLL